MRVIDEKGQSVTHYDLSAGRLIDAIVIRPEAAPIDNATKFAWEDGDYEKVQVYIPNSEETPEQKIAQLKAQLAATDYRIIKCAEHRLLELPTPYDMAQLHEQRQALRDEINRLEGAL